MQINMNEDAMIQPITLRERVIIHILLVIATMLARPKYSHQWDKLIDPIYEAVKSK